MGTKESNSDTGKVGPCTEAQPVNTNKTPIEAKTTPRRNALAITPLTEIIIFYPIIIKNTNESEFMYLIVECQIWRLISH